MLKKYLLLWVICFSVQTNSANLDVQALRACKGDGEAIIYVKSDSGKFSVCAISSDASEYYKINLVGVKNSGGLDISSNDSLFRRDEQLEASVDNDGKFSLVSLMAKDSYQVSLILKSDGAYLADACHIVKKESPVPDIESVSQVVLCKDYSLLKMQKFSTATAESIFEPREMVFDKSQSSANFFIDSEKVFLFSEAQESSRTKMYLVQGDSVEVLESKSEWILIRYINNKAKAIERWIKISAIL